MIITEKIKKSDNKTEENKAQHNSDRQTAKISALSSGNVNKHGFLSGFLTDVLHEKAATIKRFDYSQLDKELRAQTDIAKDQYKLFKDQMNVNNNHKEKN